jgi:hypothetical protein
MPNYGPKSGWITPPRCLAYCVRVLHARVRAPPCQRVPPASPRARAPFACYSTHAHISLLPLALTSSLPRADGHHGCHGWRAELHPSVVPIAHRAARHHHQTLRSRSLRHVCAKTLDVSAPFPFPTAIAEAMSATPCLCTGVWGQAATACSQPSQAWPQLAIAKP